MSELWQVVRGDDPLVATAIHDGHELRPEILAQMVLSEPERLREEDPYTGRWTEVASTRIVARISRFEVDLNRPRDRAVYLRPEDAWGLELYEQPLSSAAIDRSLAEYDRFYTELHELLADLVRRHGTVVVLDLHSYNHLRQGPAGPAADPAQNPEVNIGTGTLDRDRFGGIVERFMADLTGYDFMGRPLDVRENVKFRGGQLSRWAHATFPGCVGVLAVEFKKIFMDEWSGELHAVRHEEILRALTCAARGVRAELQESLRP